MFPLTYLSSTDRNRLEQLKAIIDNPRLSREDRDIADKERTEIESRRKPLEQTTYEEAQDFRIFLFSKMRKLAQAGAGVQVQQFGVFIQQVEQRLYLLQFEASKKAMEEEKTRIEVGKGLRHINGKPLKAGRGRVSSQSGGNPWAIPLDDDD